jgi:hypothetical protein
LKGDGAHGILAFVKVTPPNLDESTEFLAPTPAPPELARQAAELVRAHPECFWFWHPEALVQSLEDVRSVVEHLRHYGDRSAWWEAQELHRCLLQSFKNKS